MQWLGVSVIECRVWCVDPPAEALVPQPPETSMRRILAWVFKLALAVLWLTFVLPWILLKAAVCVWMPFC